MFLIFREKWGSIVLQLFLTFDKHEAQLLFLVFGAYIFNLMYLYLVCVFFCCCSILFKFTLWTKNNKSILSYTLSLYCEFTNVYTDDKLTNWKRRFILKYSSELVLNIRSWGSACSLSDFSLRVIVLKLFLI